MQENNKNLIQNNDLPLDVYSIIRALLKDWWMIITAGIVGMLMAYVVVATAYAPSYTSSMTFIVSSKGATNNISDLTAANEMAETFSEVLNSRLLKKRVQEELNLSYLPGTITTTVVAETNLMTLKVSAPSPEHAFKIMKSVLNNYTEITDYVLPHVVLDVLEAPQVPIARSNPISARWMMRKYALLAMAAMMALLALIDYLRDDVKNEREVELKLDAKLLGTIYHEVKNKTLKAKLQRKKKGLAVTDPMRSFLFVENYKKLRTKIMYKTKHNEGKIILVTSVMENEGKSTVAANIALTLAQKSDRVVLMDGDIRRPAIYKILQQKLEKNQEIGEFLKGKVEVGNVIYFDAETGLNFLIGTKHYTNSTELVSGERMRDLLRAVRKYAEYVVIDTPPTSLMADAEIMSEYADVSLLVVRQSTAPVKMINDTIDMLEGSGSEFLGCIFNDVKTRVFSGKRVFSGYGYGYGGYKYGYGRYGRYGYGRYGYGNYGYGKYGYGKRERKRYVKPQSEAPIEELKLHEE